jgi:HK97 family phage major capsid protein
MAELQLKEVQDFLSEELQVLKKDFSKARTEDQTSFDTKVKDAMDKLALDLQTKHAEIQKEFDNALTEINEKSKAQLPSQRKNFGWSLHETLKENHASLLASVKSGKGGEVNMKAFDYNDFTGYEPFVTDFRDPILVKYEQFHYRNILPSGTMAGEFVKYPKETTTTGGADTWAYGTGSEGANEAKPEIEPKMTTYQADATWIAGLIKEVPISMIEDLAWMSSFLSNKGRAELLKKEDTWIQGLLTNSTNSEDYDGSKTNIVEIIIDAAFRQLKNNLHNPNGVVLSNADYVSILLNQATGSGEFDLPAVTTVNPATGLLQMVGMPVFSHSYFAQGTGLVGDWNEAQLLTRQAPRIRFFDQNSDNAEKNVILVRIEERVALPVFYDNAFIKLAIPS